TDSHRWELKLRKTLPLGKAFCGVLAINYKIRGNRMDILTAIYTRRSVRRFTQEPLSDKDLETLLRAAMQAPSADNGQPWHFIVINDRVLMDKIPSIHPWSEMMKEAALGILVCGQVVDGEMG